jgi:hypothetical protein
MITDIDYRDDQIILEDEFSIPVQSILVSSPTLHLENTLEKICQLACGVQRFCEKNAIPIFNHPDTMKILIDLFG